jgi:peroxiredoxin
MSTTDAVPTGALALSGLEPGTLFPDLELPDHGGYVWKLSDLVGGDPTFVNFFRGWWCPKEQAFFRRLTQLQDEAEVAYTRMVSISVDPPETLAAFRAGLGARWTFLSDAERRHIEDLGLREATDTLNNPYLPVSFLLLPGLEIYRVFDGYWFWGRPTAEEIRTGFRDMSRMVRPDWESPRP